MPKWINLDDMFFINLKPPNDTTLQSMRLQEPVRYNDFATQMDIVEVLHAAIVQACCANPTMINMYRYIYIYTYTPFSGWAIGHREQH